MNSRIMLTLGLCLIFALGLFSALSFVKNEPKKTSTQKEFAKEITGEIGIPAI